MTIKRRIEITVFRRQRLTSSGVVSAQSGVPPPTSVEDKSLVVEEVLALVKRLTSESHGSAIEVEKNKDATDEVKATKSDCDPER